MPQQRSRRPQFLHPGVLQIEMEGSRRWAVAVWSIPDRGQDFRDALQRLVRATLALEWIQPLRGGESLPPKFSSVDLILYADPQKNAEVMSALEEMGFSALPTEALTKKVKKRLSVFASEARRQEVEIPDEPVALYRLAVDEPDGELARLLGAVCRRAEAELKGQVWGDEPGRFSKVFCDQLRLEVNTQVLPTSAGLAMLEDVVVNKGTGITWVEPAVFQAICDFVAVVLQSRQDLEVQWGLCAVDEKSGLAPPPVIRLRRRGGPWHTVTLGQEVVARIALPWGEQTGHQLVSLEKEIRQAPEAPA